MKKLLLLPLLSFLYSFLSQVKENLVIPKKAKIGLSLSGGGARVLPI